MNVYCDECGALTAAECLRTHGWQRCFCCREAVTENERCGCELVREDVRGGQQIRCVTHNKENEPALWEAWPS